MRYVYAFLVFAGILLLLLPVAVPVMKTPVDFSIFNTNWAGCSGFATVLADHGKLVPILYPYTDYELDERGALIVVGPDVTFSPSEIKAVNNFLYRGGTLFIADDFGTASDLIEGLEVVVE